MKAYERLLSYVKVHTTSSEETGTHPSFDGEFVLAKQLAAELEGLGVEKVRVDDKCYVYGCLPATLGYEGATPLGFIAHMDTSPEASGLNVNPQIHENYNGEALELGTSGKSLTVDRFPFLPKFKGETLITTDGTTLLGADDKAGIAEIMTAIEEIVTNALPHGELWFAFTPDEEIGEGADFFDVKGFGARYAYTVDGGDVDCLEYENFNAAGAKVEITGLSVHPGSAKNTMINASNVAMEFHNMLPVSQRPEYTDGYDGFFHLTDMEGTVTSATLKYIIRDHSMEEFLKKKAILTQITDYLNAKYGEGTITLTLRDSYFNMLEKIKPHMHLIDIAKAAIADAGMTPEVVPIRGGTDGARLSYEGLPCPNLGTGGYNFHGEYECITVERMDKAVQVILGIVDSYSRETI